MSQSFLGPVLLSLLTDLRRLVKMSPDFLRGEWGRILLMGLQRVMEGPREVPCSVWESAMSPSSVTYTSECLGDHPRGGFLEVVI